MAAQNVHVTHINDVLTNIYSGIDPYQSAVAIDAPGDLANSWVHSDANAERLYYSAQNKYTDISTGTDTYLDCEFADLTARGDIYADNRIYHRGDTDTFVAFDADSIAFQAGGVPFLEMIEGASDYIHILTDTVVDNDKYIGFSTDTYGPWGSIYYDSATKEFVIQALSYVNTDLHIFECHSMHLVCGASGSIILEPGSSGNTFVESMLYVQSIPHYDPVVRGAYDAIMVTTAAGGYCWYRTKAEVRVDIDAEQVGVAAALDALHVAAADPHTQYVLKAGSLTQITTRNHSDLQSLQGGTSGQYYHLTSAQLAALHAAVTVSDTATVDLTLTGQALSAAVIQAGIDHGSISGLGDDDHSQYYNQARGDARYSLATHRHYQVYDSNGMSGVVALEFDTAANGSFTGSIHLPDAKTIGWAGTMATPMASIDYGVTTSKMLIQNTQTSGWITLSTTGGYGQIHIIPQTGMGGGLFLENLQSVTTTSIVVIGTDSFGTAGRTGIRTPAELRGDIGAAAAADLTAHANLTTLAHGLGASAFHADSYFALAAHDHYQISVSDTRSTDPAPSAITGHAISTFFNNNYGDTWRSGFAVAGWVSANYCVWELSSPSSTTATEGLKYRVGLASTWSPWRLIAHDGNIASIATPSALGVSASYLPYASSTTAWTNSPLQTDGTDMWIATASPVHQSGYHTITLNASTYGGQLAFQNSGVTVGYLWNTADYMAIQALAEKHIRLITPSTVAIGTSFTPVSLNTNYRALEFQRAMILAAGSANTDLEVASNGYYDDVGWKYKSAGKACKMQLYNGAIYFATCNDSNNGVANDPISFVDQLTISVLGDVYSKAFGANSWTPVPQVSGGTNPTYATKLPRVKRIGNTVDVWLDLIGSGATAGAGTGVLLINLPYAAHADLAANDTVVGNGNLLNGTSNYPLNVRLEDANYIKLESYGTEMTGNHQNSTASRKIQIHFRYEMA